MRKILAVILSIAMVISFIPTTAFAAEGGSSTVTYKLVDQITDGESYIISNVNTGSGYALANDNGKIAKVNITVATGDVDGDGTGDIYISSDDESIVMTAVSDSGGFKLTNGGKSLYYSSSSYSSSSLRFSGSSSSTWTYADRMMKTDQRNLYYSTSSNNFNASSSHSSDKVYIYEKVTNGEGGGDPATTADIELTPNSSNSPSKNKTVEVGETFTVEITNGSTSNNYNFAVTFSKSGVASVDEATRDIDAGRKAIFTFTADNAGDTKITFSNNNSQYGERKATINLTVTGGGTTEPTPEADVKLTPSTKNPSDTKLIDVGEVITVAITNGSEYGKGYTFTATSSSSEIANVNPTSKDIAAGETATYEVRGISGGTATITFSNNNGDYSRMATLTVNVNSGTTPVTPPSDGTVKVGFTSDVHGETANLENWLKKLPVKLDNMCFCGDYSYSYDQSKYKSDYDKVVDLTERYIGTGRGIYTAGNHEYQNGNNLNDYSGIKRLGEAAVSTNAYKVYCLGAYRFDGIGEFQSSDYTALDDYLKGVSPTTPVFILSHFPLHYIQSRTITNAKAVIDVLNKYPNAVFMWGHNHSQNGESHYGEVKSFGESIQYNSTQSATISFTYACAGAMNDSQGKYDGCVASVKGDEVTLSYYDADGSQPNIKGKSSTSFKVDISEWSAQQGTDPQPSGDTIENGKYIIVANGKALTTSAGAGYSNGSGSESYTYSGLSGKDYTNGATAVTSDMIWDIQKSGNGYTIKNGNNFLNGTYSNNKGVLKLDSTQDIWTYSENRLTSTNSNKQLEYGNSGGTASTIFTMRSTGSDITLYKYSSGSTSTDPASVTVPVAATNLVYNGSLQTGVAAGTGYTLAGNTATNAGNYTATATLAEGYKWSDNTTVPKTISWSISKATPTITSPSASAITSGQALNNSTLSGGQAKLGDVAVNGTFTWKNGATIPALTDSEKTEYDVTFTPNDNTNYNSAECKVKVKVNNSALTGLTITQAPGKVIYTVGDKFDSKEMIVKANYADGSSAVITNYTVTPDRELKLSDKSVTVSYKEGNITMTVAQAITVNEMETVATPALPAATVFLDKKYITITCATEGAVIYYTVDGTTPTADSTKYTGSFLIGETTTVKALAVKEGMNNSAIASASYTRGMPFTDVSQSDWFYNDVYYVYINGIMEGTGATIFNPNLFTTRAMIVTMLYRLENEPAVGGTNPFGDVTNGKWYTEAIKWAYKNKIVEGYTPTQFGPNDTITREQLAAILYRYAKYKGYDLSAGESTNILSFTDANKVSSYAVTAVQWAVGEGLINGVTPTTLSPKTGATRAQVAAILHRFCENVK